MSLITLIISNNDYFIVYTIYYYVKTITRDICFRSGLVNACVFLQWVVSLADKAKYDDLFSKTDIDMDGLVSGPEVRDIFLRTGLPSATLARIWWV